MNRRGFLGALLALPAAAKAASVPRGTSATATELRPSDDDLGRGGGFLYTPGPLPYEKWPPLPKGLTELAKRAGPERSMRIVFHVEPR